MDHTKEPWGTKYRNRPDGMMAQEIFDKDGDTIATMSWYSVRIDEKKIGTNREANARRIVACVNACAGIETETLEAPGSIADIIHAHRDNEASLRSALAEKTAQVERLRETLKQMQTSICGYAITSEESSIRLVHRFYETVRMHDELASEALSATAGTGRDLCGKG